MTFCYLDDILTEYPEFPRLVAIKIEMQRRGVEITKSAENLIDPSIHQVQERSFSRELHCRIPVSFYLRDGTSVIVRCNDGYPDPLMIDITPEGGLGVFDKGVFIESVYPWEKPLYYNYTTSLGNPMWKIINARPQRLEINPYQKCLLWERPCGGCKFCGIAGTFSSVKKAEEINPIELDETLTQALKEKGRFTNIMLTGGIDYRGKEVFDNEVDRYISVLNTIGNHFGKERFPSQLIGAAYSYSQLKRIFNETKLMTYSANLEVLNEKMFAAVCPGKHELIGYQEWKKRLFNAVEIFGAGNVNTGIVAGVELAKPFGFHSESKAVESTLREAESLMSRGVDVVSCVWRIDPRSIFRNQTIPSLKYYLDLSLGLLRLRRHYNLSSDIDSYTRCGNHPDMDLQRVF